MIFSACLISKDSPYDFEKVFRGSLKLLPFINANSQELFPNFMPPLCKTYICDSEVFIALKWKLVVRLNKNDPES